MTWNQPEAFIHATRELDLHADTCIAGHTKQVVEVSAFSKEHTILQDVPMVIAATAYEDPSNGTTYILSVGQAIWLGDKAESTLLYPNQL
jgi:hypothetical protein